MPRLGFGSFLVASSAVTLIALSVAFTTALQVAVNAAPAFSSGMIRQGHWPEVIDFLEQLPPQKLAFIFLTHDSSHVLLGLLACLNALLVVGWVVQRVLFRACTSSEIKAAREAVIQFTIFRLIFLGAILETGMHARSTPSSSEAQAANATAADSPAQPLAPGAGGLREMCVWLGWFMVIGFVRWFLVLLRERFQTAQASPHSTTRTFVKYLVVAGVFALGNLALGLAVFFVFRAHTTLDVLALLLFENAVLVLSCVRILSKYSLYIRSLQKEQPWEERGSALYYSDMACEILIQIVTLAHLVHIWSHYGLSFSLLDFFFFAQVQQLLVGVYRSLRAVRTYSKAIWELNARFPDATPEEIRAIDDVCSICRDTMEQAKKLPCNHFFHRSCLIQWIEFQSFCPSCRASLIPAGAAPNAHATRAANPALARQTEMRAAVAGLPPAMAAEVNAMLAQQQAAMAHFAQQHQQRLQQQQQLQQQAAANPSANAAAGPNHSDATAGSPPSASSVGGSGVRDTGLRYRGPRDSSSASSSSSATFPHAHSFPGGSHTHPSSHAHLHAPGPHGHMHAHGPSPQQASSVFRLDTSRFSWLPSFSLEAQIVREGPHPAYPHAMAHRHSAASTQGATLEEDVPPPLEAIPTSSATAPTASAAAAAAAAPDTVGAPPLAALSLDGAHSPAAAPTTTPSSAAASSSTSSLSAREQIYLATQRRLGQQTVPPLNDHGAQAGAAAPSALNADDEDVGVDADSSLPLPSGSPLLVPSSSSPLLLSQADADADLARQLQAEENALAAEEQRNNAGGFARFFSL